MAPVFGRRWNTSKNCEGLLMGNVNLRPRLEQLLSESLPSVRQRQETTLDATLGGFDRPFVLFGAGGLGRKIAVALSGLGHRPAAFMDNNEALWGTEIGGIPVLSPPETARRHASELPGVLVTIWSGQLRDTMSERIAPLRRLGFERFGLWSHFAWRHPRGLLPHYCVDLPEKVLAHRDEIIRACELLEDNGSRELFTNHIEWRLTQNFDLLPKPVASTIYFDPGYYTDSAEDVVYDIGAFDGDSLRDFVRVGRGYREYHAFEPVGKSYAKLVDTCQSLGAARAFPHKLVVGNENGEVAIDGDGGAASRVGRGNETVRAVTVDGLADQLHPPTILKMDTEGFEPKCLEGARHTIEEHRPVVAASAYHEQGHIWSLLLQLHHYYPGYRFNLRPHFPDGWDLVLYAVPPERVSARFHH